MFILYKKIIYPDDQVENQEKIFSARRFAGQTHLLRFYCLELFRRMNLSCID